MREIERDSGFGVVGICGKSKHLKKNGNNMVKKGAEGLWVFGEKVR